MTQHFQAIFEGGVFRPLEHVQLAEHQQVLITVSSPGEETLAVDSGEVLCKQKEALAKLRSEMNSLPIQSPPDDLGGADHDLILYGRQK